MLSIFANSNNVSRCIVPLMINVIVLYVMFSLIAYSWIEKIDNESMDLVLQAWSNQNAPGGRGRSSFRQQQQQQLRNVAGGGGGGRKKNKYKNLVLPRHDSQRYLHDLQHSDILQDEKYVQERVKELRLPYNIKTPPIIQSSAQIRSSSTPPLLSYNEIMNCPKEIKNGYPESFNLVDILEHWNPDETDIPTDQSIYQSICYIDWSIQSQRQVAMKYRQAEVPFIIRNHPEINKASIRWSNYTYLETLLGGEQTLYRNEHSLNNHFMYWKADTTGGSGGGGSLRTPPKNWLPPTENIELSFNEWYQHAINLEMKYNNTKNPSTSNEEHWYLRLNGELYSSKNDFLYDELPIFNPTQSSFFMVDPNDQRGINCRLGMKGVIAESHYDMSRNFILLLKGQKRYIIGHPNQCINMELYPKSHPSARHSSVNWSNPNDWYDHNKYPNFYKSKMNELILQAGDILYLPTSWFHFIVSLNMNYQCNARCGITYENSNEITKCGL